VLSNTLRVSSALLSRACAREGATATNECLSAKLSRRVERIQSKTTNNGPNSPGNLPKNLVAKMMTRRRNCNNYINIFTIKMATNLKIVVSSGNI